MTRKKGPARGKGGPAGRTVPRLARTVRVPRSVRIVNALRFFVRENARMVLFFAGAVTLVQALLPWTNMATDRVLFIVFGSIMLGIAIPRRLWFK